jgi:hypothetical protein
MTEKDRYRADFVLYLHRDEATNDIFYVGIGQRRRAFEKRGRNFLWKRYVEVHGLPKVDIYKTNLTVTEAIYLESSFIKAIGKRIDNTGNLTNLDDGGTGVTPTRRLEESIKKRIEKSAWYKQPTGEAHWNYGRKLTEEERNKCGESFRGKKQSEEHKSKKGFKKGQTLSAESIKKMADSLRGKKQSEELIAKKSEFFKQQWKSEEYIRRRKDYMSGRVMNSRKVIDSATGIVYDSGKEAAIALGIAPSYFAGMIGGAHNNKTSCSYLEPRPFSNGKERKHKDTVVDG